MIETVITILALAAIVGTGLVLFMIIATLVALLGGMAR
jgi:hypothetical protein